MDEAKEISATKKAAPFIVGGALVLAIVGALTGLFVMFLIGMVGMAITIAAATLKARKERRAARGAPAEGER